MTNGRTQPIHVHCTLRAQSLSRTPLLQCLACPISRHIGRYDVLYRRSSSGQKLTSDVSQPRPWRCAFEVGFGAGRNRSVQFMVVPPDNGRRKNARPELPPLLLGGINHDFYALYTFLQVGENRYTTGIFLGV